MTRIGPNGLTKAWRGPNGERKLTFREAATRGVTFTVFLSRNFGPQFFYISARLFGRWVSWHWLKRNQGIV